MGTVTTCKISI